MSKNTNDSNITIKPKKTVLDWIKSNKTFVIALSVILSLMITAFILTQTIPAGKFEKDPTTGDYILIPKDVKFKFWQFILSPFLLFGTSAGKSAGIIIAFLFIISGAMGVMEKSHVLNYTFDRIVDKFKNNRHLLLIIIATFFMLIGSLIGCYDEIIPFVPLLILLVGKFGFGKHIGISVSLFAIGAGFATGILNPFLVAIPQQQAKVPAFSGMWMRIVAFAVFWIFTCAYILLKSKKDKDNLVDINEIKTTKLNPSLGKAGIAFGLSVLLGFIMVILILFVPALKPVQDGGYSLLFLAGAFLLGSILAAYITKIPPKSFISNFTNGIKPTIMAGILLILASSISYILEASFRMHTILNAFVEATYGTSPLGYLFIFYGLFLLFGLFMASGSARAFLLIPILAPIAKTYGILYPMFLAFALADGICSLFYPTNSVIIVILNITKTDYSEYVKKNWVYFVGFFVLSILLITFAYLVNYGAYPF